MRDASVVLRTFVWVRYFLDCWPDPFGCCTVYTGTYLLRTPDSGVTGIYYGTPVVTVLNDEYGVLNFYFETPLESPGPLFLLLAFCLKMQSSSSMVEVVKNS